MGSSGLFATAADQSLTASSSNIFPLGTTGQMFLALTGYLPMCLHGQNSDTDNDCRPVAGKNQLYRLRKKHAATGTAGSLARRVNVQISAFQRI